MKFKQYRKIKFIEWNLGKKIGWLECKKRCLNLLDDLKYSITDEDYELLKNRFKKKL